MPKDDKLGPLQIEACRGMFVLSDDGLAILDADGRIVEHNAAFHELLRFRDVGGASVSLVGSRLADLVATTEDPVPGFADYLRCSERGTFEARTSAGAKSVEVKARPLQSADREAMGTLVLVHDIAEDLQIAARDAVIQRDLSRARALQRVILSEPAPIPRYDLELVYSPLDQVGGDLYDFAMLPAGCVRIFIADATGHGVAAGLVTMLVKSAYDSVRHTLGGPAAVLEALNDRIAGTYRSFDAMFTGMVIDLSTSDHTIHYSSAGHPPPIVVDKDGVRELDSGGTVLGVEAYKTYPSWTRKLDPEASLYLVTDGLEEARRGSREYFGEKRLHELIASANELPKAGQGILEGIEAWLEPYRPTDDITIIALRPTARRSAAAAS